MCERHYEHGPVGFVLDFKLPARPILTFQLTILEDVLRIPNSILSRRFYTGELDAVRIGNDGLESQR